jgi:hypothetical protein
MDGHDMHRAHPHTRVHIVMAVPLFVRICAAERPNHES